MNQSSLIDIAWAAGLFEGEGCITSCGKHKAVRLSLSSTDRDVVERFARVVGAGSLNRMPKRPSDIGTKPLWTWQSAASEADLILRELLPFLGERRSARAAEVVAVRTQHVAESMRERLCAGCGHTFAPAVFQSGARNQRYCDATCRMRANIAKRDIKRDVVGRQGCAT